MWEWEWGAVVGQEDIVIMTQITTALHISLQCKEITQNKYKITSFQQ